MPKVKMTPFVAQFGHPEAKKEWFLRGTNSHRRCEKCRRWMIRRVAYNDTMCVACSDENEVNHV